MDNRKLTIIGAGNIGRGVVGSIFFEAGYELTFIDSNEGLLKQMGENGHYTVQRLGTDKKETIVVSGYKVISVKDQEAVNTALAETDLVTCCVYKGAFETICNHLAEAIAKRAEKGRAHPYNILLCVNALGAPEYFEKNLRKRLSGNKEASAYFEENTALVQVLVNLSSMPGKTREDPLALTTSLGDVLEIDGDAMIGSLNIRNVETTDGARQKMLRKIYCGNMMHCMTAFMGNYLGYRYIPQCMENKKLMAAATYALYESDEALSREYYFDEEERKSWMKYMLSSWDPNVMDDVRRIAVNPAEKLSRDNRFVAPALLCLRHGILPYYLARGIAYGFWYDAEEDGQSREIRQYIDKHGIHSAVLRFCGLDEEKDFVLVEMIEKQYRDIGEGVLLYEI